MNLFLCSSLMKGSSSHKMIDLAGNPILKIYYTSRVSCSGHYTCIQFRERERKREREREGGREGGRGREGEREREGGRERERGGQGGTGREGEREREGKGEGESMS